MLGDGIVSFGVWPSPVVSFRKSNASAKIGSSRLIFSSTFSAAGVNSISLLGCAQLRVVDAAGLVVLAGLEQLGRAQQRADVIGPKRRLVAHGHAAANYPDRPPANRSQLRPRRRA